MTRHRTRDVWLMLLVMTLSAASAAASADRTADRRNEAEAIVDRFGSAYAALDWEGMSALLHPRLEEPHPDMLRELLRAEGKRKNPPQIRIESQAATTQADGILVRATRHKTWPDEPERDGIEHWIFRLIPDNATLKIAGIYEELEGTDFDSASRALTSQRGQYTLSVPEGWTAVKGPVAARGTMTEAISLMSADFQSSVMIGFVQMPTRLGDTDTDIARGAMEADMDMERRLCSAHAVLDTGPIQFNDLPGYQALVEVDANDVVPRKRWRVYLSEDPLLYVFVCDMRNPSTHETSMATIRGVLDSFRLIPNEGGRPRTDIIAAENAKGTVTGNVYTSEAFNCFIAAPDGWTIRTSPNPAHLAEMSYESGGSLVRLIGAKVPGEMVTADVAAQRIEAVRTLVIDFEEHDRQEIELAGVPAIQSVQTFRVDPLGHFHVNEVTLIHEGIYYLILCQCIEPDDYAVLKEDFDKVFESFGLIQ